MRRLFVCMPLLLAACVQGAPGPASPAGGAAPVISTADDAEAYVLRVVAQNGCTLSLDQFEQRRAADGLLPTEADLSGPGGIAKLQVATLVDAAPFSLINKGLLVEDAADPRIVTSTGPGCA